MFWAECFALHISHTEIHIDPTFVFLSVPAKSKWEMSSPHAANFSRHVLQSFSRHSTQRIKMYTKVLELKNGIHTLMRNSSLHFISSSKPTIQLYKDSLKLTEMKIYSWVSCFFWECMFILSENSMLSVPYQGSKGVLLSHQISRLYAQRS